MIWLKFDYDFCKSFDLNFDFDLSQISLPTTSYTALSCNPHSFVIKPREKNPGASYLALVVLCFFFSRVKVKKKQKETTISLLTINSNTAQRFSSKFMQAATINSKQHLCYLHRTSTAINTQQMTKLKYTCIYCSVIFVWKLYSKNQ